MAALKTARDTGSGSMRDPTGPGTQAGTSPGQKTRVQGAESKGTGWVCAGTPIPGTHTPVPIPIPRVPTRYPGTHHPGLLMPPGSMA